MTQPVVLVTGASSGIGAATAQYLAARNYTVFAAARRADKLEALRTPNLHPLVMDVTSDESVQTGVQQIMSQTGRIDAVVNNAGLGLYGMLEGIPIPEAQAEFEVNVFGLMRVTQAVLPIMRAQKSGRIINMSSLTGQFPTAYAGWYGASKHAVEALSQALWMEVLQFGIEVIVIQPGAIRTEFNEVALESEVIPEGYEKLMHAAQTVTERAFRSAPDGEVVAKAVYRALQAKKPRFRYVVTMQARLTLPFRGLLSNKTLLRWLLGWLK